MRGETGRETRVPAQLSSCPAARRGGLTPATDLARPCLVRHGGAA